MKIAVTGATGFVGSHLVETLLSRGHEVSCLARSPDRTRWLAGNKALRFVYGDLEADQALRSLVDGQDAVVHAAALVRAPSQEEFTRVNVQGTANVLRAIEHSGKPPRQLLFVSSMAALGPSRAGEAVPEDAELRPVSRYGVSKAMAEAALRERGGACPVTVVRPPVVYGPRDKDVLAYFRLVARGIRPVLGYQNTVSVLYVKNLVAGMALAIERPATEYRAYSFTDGGAYQWTELAEIIAECLGRKTVGVRVPAFAIRLVTAISGLYGSVAGRAVLLNRDKLTEMRQPYWLVSDERARQELGYRPLWTTIQAVAETAAWYRAEGWL